MKKIKKLEKTDIKSKDQMDSIVQDISCQVFTNFADFIICSKFNKNICDKLLNIAQDKLLQSNMTYQSVRVPGAFEIPSALSICLSDRFAGYVLLGCVIRSETSHFDYVCKESWTQTLFAFFQNTA